MREQLTAILKAPQFSQAARLRSFLSYVVEETLAGRAKQLSQYSLAMDVFERDEAFDPSIDAIVRVEAARLRSKLREYYYEFQSEGAIIIELSKGSYAAAFHRKPASQDHAVTEIPRPASAAHLASAKPASPRSGDPTIAVLPFTDMSPIPDQEYLADGLCEDLMTDLSKISGISVIARQSTFSYKGKSLTIKQICDELGADYAIEGSVRKVGDQLRINAQLIEGSTEKHLWAERYDCDYSNLFATQDRVNRDIVNALSIRFSPSLALRSPTNDMRGYDYVLLGIKEAQPFTKEGSANAQYCYERAIEIDPDYADAHARLSFNRTYQWVAGWDNSHETSVGLGLKLAERGIALGETSSLTHAALCWALAWNGEHDRAIAVGRKACALNPNDVDALERLLMALVWANEADEAGQVFARAKQLNPLEPYNASQGMLHYMQHNYSQAVEFFELSVENHPNFFPAYVYLASIFGSMGKIDQAEKVVSKILEMDPAYLFVRCRYAQFKHEADKERFTHGLQAAGAQTV